MSNSKRNANKFIAQFKKKLEKSNNLQFEICVDLAIILDEKLWPEQEMGFYKWAAHLTGLQRDSLRKKVRVGRVFGPLKFDRGLVIPVHRMLLIKNIVTQKNVTAVLREVRGMSEAELADFITKRTGKKVNLQKTEYTSGYRLTPFCAHVRKKELVIVEEALLRMMKTGEAKTRGEALVAICKLFNGAAK